MCIWRILFKEKVVWTISFCDMFSCDAVKMNWNRNPLQRKHGMSHFNDDGSQNVTSGRCTYV